MNILNESKLAICLINNHKFKEAEGIYLNLLKEYPQNPTVLAFLGLLYIKWKKFKKAEICFEKAYSIEKSEVIIYNLATIKEHFSKPEEALNLFQELLNLNKKVEYYINITNLLINLTIFTDRKKYINILYHHAKEGLTLYPLDKNIILNFSIASIYSGNLQEGEKYCNLALKLDSKFPKAWAHQGLINEFLYSDEDIAQECYKNAIKYKGNTSNYYDIAISYTKTNNYKEAIKYFHKSLKPDPKNKTILLGIAQCYFKQRKFNLGYRYYLKYNSEKFKELKNQWDGGKYKDKTLFVYPDLGYGDQILYIRYLPLTTKYFKSVKVFVFPQLYDVFKDSFKQYPNIEFIKIESGIKYPKYDYSVILSNLPYYLKKDFKNIPFSDKYLGKEKTKTEKIKNIGICWEAGNADIRTTIHRTINIKEFEPILNLKDYNFFSFQVGASTDDYKDYKNLQDLGKDFKSFKDTQEALKNMDLIISVDTSTANLAGAMGIKTFLLLPYYPDWRWFDNEEKTEWYDSINIFKQKEKNSWISEFKRIKDFLNNN